MTRVVEKEPSTAVARTPNGALSAVEMAGSVTDLLRLAVEKGTPVEQLEKLVDLHERMAARQARSEFFAALAAFQQECPPIKKDSTAKIATKSGSSYAFTYAELPDIAKAISPYLVKHGLGYRWDTVVDGNAVRCVCIVTHVGGHSEPSSFTVPIENASGMSPQQKVGAACTYAQRRSLSNALGITTTDDEPADDPTPIDDDQVIAIEDLIQETGANLDRFLKYMRVESLAKIPAARYQEAVSALQQKRGRK